MIDLEELFDRLWPINRSLTGPGYRESLEILSEVIPFEVLAFTSGMQVNGWTVPDEWTVREAYLLNPSGHRIADVQVNNLHLWSHSVPCNGVLSRADLLPHLYTDPTLRHAIPYRTTYYEPNWGFCLPDYTPLPEGEYRVYIDTSLTPGNLLVGETVLDGDTDAEILFSTYLCHPSMANNELSGPLAMATLYERLKNQTARRPCTYRFAIMPETIGSLCYLSQRGQSLKSHLLAGLVLSCVGDAHPFTYKRSRQGATRGDRAMQVLTNNTFDFDPTRGSDERNYCAPGWDLPMGVLMASVPGTFPEYHTSDDNKDFITFDKIEQAAALVARWAALVTNTTHPRSQYSQGAPKFGADLYPSGGTKAPQEHDTAALLWAANLSDGQHDLLAMAERSRQPIERLADALAILEARGYLCV